MSRELNPQTKLKLSSDDKTKDFTIEYRKGTGGSCVAYVWTIVNKVDRKNRKIK